MSLLALQHRMRAWLSEPDAAQIPDTSQGPSFEVYRNNYRVQLLGCLETSYPMLRDWLGTDTFLQAAIHHIDHHPPHAWTLDVYGADFQATLQALHPHNPDAHELAWIEWSLAESFVASDMSAGASLHALNARDWDAMRLQLAPSLRQCRATTNAAALWQAWFGGEPFPEAAMLPAPGGLITWRKDLTCRLKQLDAIEYAALQLLHDDNRFAGMCDALVEHCGEEAGVRRAGELLADWLDARIVRCAS
jgi:hypothetical protein